ncbi:hypothetical protein [Nocardioides sp. B-3]|uniref:hypothetical protein n=1 Tax=Nocardioides sp. B-3 TaxID=2895565 RepID=UPI00215257E8|nr:hypothetical protein [Nocardioides sp. B-3]UUZ59250.1 hypothetical protein LP418_25810 [Nocardioides sp. B-3]
MIETTDKPSTRGHIAPPALAPAEVDLMLAKVTTTALPTDDATRIDVLRGLEQLKCAVEGAQAAIAVAFDSSQRRRAADRGVRPEKQGEGIGHQIALARRVSPQRGSRHLGLAKVLTNEMPHTMNAARRSHHRMACHDPRSRDGVPRHRASPGDRRGVGGRC